MDAPARRLPNDFHSFPIARQWRARWIRPADREAHRWLFRHEVDIAEPEGCTLFISAVGEYELWINGTRITTGPPPGQAFWTFYDTIDLTPWLQAGANCIGIVLAEIDQWHKVLLAELIDAEGNVLAATDDSWRATSRTGWLAGAANEANAKRQEIIDLRCHPQGWTLPGFDDSAWACADVPGPDPQNPYVYGGAYRMTPRDIPLLEETPVAPAAIVAVEEGQEILSRSRKEWLSVQLSAAGQPITHALADNVESLLDDESNASFRCSLNHLDDRAFDGIWCPNVVLDFGNVYSGYLEIELDVPEGTILEIGYVERLLNGHFNNAIEVPYADQVTLPAGRTTFRCAIWKSYRYAKLRFSRCFEPVTVHRVRAIHSGYPFRDNGAFESPDQALVKAFEISRHTIRLCSRDYLMDGPWREKIQWVGDVAAITLGGIYACFGDPRLPGKFLRQTMTCAQNHGMLANNSQSRELWGHQHYIPDYNLWWTQAVWNHYLYTGDERFIHECWPAVTRIVQFFCHYLNDYGLLDGMSGWVFFEHTFRPKPKELAVLTALFYGTLESVGKMAGMKGDTWFAGKVTTLRETIAANFHTRYFAPELGVYIDGYTDGEPQRTVSEHTNYGAILWGLCPEELVPQIIDRFHTGDLDYLEAEPFGAAIVLWALARAGRLDLATEIIRERWGKRMVDQGMTSTSEEWTASGSWRGPGGSYIGVYRSLSHAWSACPAEFLIRHLVGLEILEPGCRKLRLRPADIGSDYRVVFPTPQGQVVVQRTAAGLDISAPEAIQIQTGD